jgi:hypothetical protein
MSARRPFEDNLRQIVHRHAQTPPTPNEPTRTRKEIVMSEVTRASRLPAEVKASVMDALRAGLTESRTDAIIASVVAKLPWWTKWMPVAMILDRVLPDMLLGWVEDIL